MKTRSSSAVRARRRPAGRLLPCGQDIRRRRFSGPPNDARAAGKGVPVKRTYAVVWSDGGDAFSGRLETRADRLELCGRERRLSIPFGELTGASIARGHAERLRGLPVLMLQLRGGAALRIASLEGAGALHELARKVERGGLPIAV